MKLWIGKLTEFSIWVSETEVIYSNMYFKKLDPYASKIKRIETLRSDTEFWDYVHNVLVPQRYTVYEIDL